MAYTDIVFSAVVGAVIGYITNWLAIKMLFRPHEEKRIFGIKIPLTPGLIPKERKRIASSIANAVSTHLLSSDTLLESIRSNGIDKKFVSWIEEKTLQFAKNSITVGQQLKSIIGEKFDSIVRYIEDKITMIILSFVKKDDLKEEIEEFIIKSLKKELSKNPADVLESNWYQKIKDSIVEKSMEYKDSEEFKEKIENLIEKKITDVENLDKSLDEVIPAGLISTIKVYVYSKNYEIAVAIKDILKEDSVQSKIKQGISDIISQNLNPMIAMFLNPDLIYNKVTPAIDKYLDKEENQKELALFINDLIDRLLKTKVKDILSNISEESIKTNIKSIGNIITDNIDDNLIKDLITSVEDKIKDKETIEDLLTEFNICCEDDVRKFIRSKIDYVIESKEVENKIGQMINTAVDKALSTRISDLTDGKENELVNFASKTSEDLFNRFMENKALDFIEDLDIRKITEDKINSFDVDFTEKLILEIARKELSAITWLGALLGFIMGLVSSIIAAI